ncbi:MAG: Gfo/Idh/MocA family oxidoreductase [Eubacteriales bacterium]
MNPQISRRSFLKSTTGVILTSQFGCNILHAQNKGDKLRLAIIGTGGKGGEHLNCVKKAGDLVVAHCDIDSNRQGIAPATWPGSKFYQDYRVMFDKEMKNFDAVMVATPDHSHYQPTAIAMSAGKHCYTQKPLVHTVWEARQLKLGVEKFKVATQMGNQGHSGEGNRIIYEYVNGGFLGDVSEIHCVTNRPIWPQGGPRPEGEDPVPANVNWDLWLGSLPYPVHFNNQLDPPITLDPPEDEKIWGAWRWYKETDVFSRIDDMFCFFRNDKMEINTGYWAEKVTAESVYGHGIREFSVEAFRENVLEYTRSILDLEEDQEIPEEMLYEIRSLLRGEDEYECVTAMRDFESDKIEFTDFWECSCNRKTYHYVWCCYALVWAISQYDKLKEAK